jgi:hypothetical protein
MICLDELLTGSPTWEQVVEFWKNGEFYQERYAVEAIEKHLQTEDQRKWMFDSRLTIEQMLNGRYPGDVEEDVYAIFAEWNAKLGFKAFGF